jgi:Tfp pilus assembly protein PilN
VSQVNLLPPDIMQRQRLRRLTYLIAAASVAVIALIVLFYIVQFGRLGTTRDAIDLQERSNRSIQRDIQALQQFDDLQKEAIRKQELLSSAFVGEVSFSGILMDVSRLMPGTAYLNQLSAQTTLSTATPPATPEVQAFVGAITFGGISTDFDTVADLLTRLERVRGWVNPWVQNAADAQGTGVTFSTGVDLDDRVLTRQGRGGTADG